MNRIFLVILACVSSIAPAWGQSAPPRHAAEFGAGWAGFVDDATAHHTTVSGAWRFQLTPRLGVGPEVVYMNGPGSDRDLVVTGNLTLDLLRPRPGRRVVPFLVAGGGLFRNANTFGSRTFSHTEGAFTAGGGIRVDAAGRMYLAADARVGWEAHVRLSGIVGIRLGAP